MRGDHHHPVRACLAALALSAGVAAECASAADGAGAPLLVHASVAPHASIRLAPPATFTVSAADVARGYVELPAPVEVRVQANVADGYTLSFEFQGVHVRRAHVSGLQAPLTVGSEGALSSRPSAGRGMWRETLMLGLRFDLAADAQPGEYAWPLQISMLAQ